jgi:hypothetical protein
MRESPHQVDSDVGAPKRGVATQLFSRLKGLFSSSGFPLEDFLSEIVATIIEHHPHVFIQWLRELAVVRVNGSLSLSVETQFYCRRDQDDETPEKYPDFLVRLSNGVEEQLIFIESKVGSDLSGADQLQLYARILSRLKAAQRTLLFVTRDYYPQDERQVLALVPEDRPKPAFVQARWFQFASFISRTGTTIAADPLVIELLSFMKSEQLTQNHQFTPQDIAALTGFHHAYSVMRSVLDAELRSRLTEVCGDPTDEYDMAAQIVRGPMFTFRNRPTNRNIGINLGFWLEPDDGGYLWVFGDLSFDAKTVGKEDVVKSLLDFVAKNDGWIVENVSASSSSGRIMKGRSLSTFLGEPNHAASIKRFLIGVIEEFVKFKSLYPGLVWSRQ